MIYGLPMTYTATAPSGKTHDVTVSETGIVKTTTGVLLGDVDGMELLGWELTETHVLQFPGFPPVRGVGPVIAAIEATS